MEPPNAFHITPIAETVSARVRRERVDAFGNRLAVLRDGERHQCRSCLALSERDEEEVILFAHRPFDSAGHPYAEVGPVFVHERDCAPYANSGVYPPELPRRQVVLRAYDATDRIVGGSAVGERPVEDAIAEAFADGDVAYLHARNLGYGCFMFRIDRA